MTSTISMSSAFMSVSPEISALGDASASADRDCCDLDKLRLTLSKPHTLRNISYQVVTNEEAGGHRLPRSHYLDRSRRLSSLDKHGRNTARIAHSDPFGNRAYGLPNLVD